MASPSYTGAGAPSPSSAIAAAVSTSLSTSDPLSTGAASRTYPPSPPPPFASSSSSSALAPELHADAQSTKTAATGTSDGDDGAIYFPTRASEERKRSHDIQQATRGVRIRDYAKDEDDEDDEGADGGGGGARLLDGKRQPSRVVRGPEGGGGSTRYNDIEGAASEGGRGDATSTGTSGGSYWRLAEEASNTISTRALERSDGGTVKERKRAYWKAAMVNATLIGAWYLFSTLISLYNKWMFSPDRYNFSYPLFVTTCHMGMQFFLASVARTLFDEKLVPRKPNGEKARPSGYEYLSKVVPCAAATALDIGLSNSSLKTITLTFYTMCKSSNLAFVLFFAFLFRLEVIRWSLIGIITLITIGVVLMVAAETKFVLVGAVQVLTASAMGGLRWTLTQMLLDRDGMGLNNPIATIFWLAPVMGACLITLSAAFEDWHAIFGAENGWFSGMWRSIHTVVLITAPGVLAFGMNLSEFALIQRTSVVTLSVAGIFKEVLTIMIASIVFGDELTPINVTGLCITLLGIGLYNYLKYRLITRGPTAFGHVSTPSVASLTELSESLRSRASSFAHSLSRSALPRGGAADGGGARHGSAAGGGRRRGYHALADGDAEGEAEGEVVFDRDGESTGHLDAVELDTQKVSVEIISTAERERERERRRKIEEEAELDGWNTSGERTTGNGYVEM
ncbi:hypothetical protein ACQY0O_004743 [Thecaphora frezii]